ncbi:cupin domain-containing protein [Streptomyces sp. OR43]|uniref:cupin domain-containing protein n=1 Tax=Streptomyces sp. or43 TaxID=2478957 RepID=UPI0011CD44B8|nr:cupin domain-containing protein [Streptomyces sp. or43]TXS41789.1 cupin domain-containing protein [Streptomyces sp. or43]
MSHTLRAVAVTTSLLGLSLVPGAAHATPGGSGVSGRVLAQHTIGDTDYVLREVTVPPGQATGWHYHDGTLYAYVRQGTLSHFDATCDSDGVYEKGSFLEEPSGADHVHVGENRGTNDVVLEVLYVLPHDAPFSQDAPAPGCSTR